MHLAVCGRDEQDADLYGLMILGPVLTNSLPSEGSFRSHDAFLKAVPKTAGVVRLEGWEMGQALESVADSHALRTCMSSRTA
jgi:hypothetical protein